GGRPGERITARPVNAAAQSGTRPIKTPFPLGVLRRPLEPGQYTSIAFAETLVLEGIAASIGSVGDAYDNALAESTIGLFKTEAVSKRSPFLSGPMKTIDDVEFATMGWVDWFNQRRLHSTLDYLTPDEFEEVYYSQESALHPEMLQA
ncbi:integrase core domain-containing protein, partial [Rhodococcus sp. I2R]|uniref:integrase core domain-containing protein n=1 Tax=Rhodococcus sp. I2R TaxID=2855445 RepID=UPI0035A8AFE4|nr:integrase core domain-containing protein [Rhodococcus sp. I2R]